MNRILFMALSALSITANAAGTIPVTKGDDALIVDGICLYETDGVAKYTTEVTSEDSGLEIVIKTSAGTVGIYDATGEIEPITTPYTWEAPTASNVRFEQNSDDLCYQLMFAADSIDDGFYARLYIRDTSTPAFMDDETTLLYLEVDGSGLDSIPWNPAWDSEIQSEATDALNAYDPPTSAEYDAGVLTTNDKVDIAQTDLDLLTGTDGATLATAQANYAPATASALATVDGIVDDIKAAVILATGTCDSGSTTTCVDAARTEANDVWKGAEIVFTSGTAAAETSCVYDFVASSDTLTFWATVGSAGTGNYILKANAICETAQDETP